MYKIVAALALTVALTIPTVPAEAHTWREPKTACKIAPKQLDNLMSVSDTKDHQAAALAAAIKTVGHNCNVIAQDTSNGTVVTIMDKNTMYRWKRTKTDWVILVGGTGYWSETGIPLLTVSEATAIIKANKR
jgi:uncharacterized Fe-S center protein